MSLLVTGATGQLGRLVVEDLLRRGVPAGEIVATGRSTDRLKDFAERGVQVRAADYADPDSLRTAFAGTTRALLISGNEPGPQRVQQHRNAIDALREAGARLVAYTSILNADGSGLRLAEDHQSTEAVLRKSDLPYVLLRNGWYIENYTAQLKPALDHGALLGGAGEGRVSAATRADYASAAAAVLTSEDEPKQVYELGGDTAFTLAELAAEITAQSGTTVRYTDLSESAHIEALTAAGVPKPFAEILADSEQGLRRGELHTGSDDLRRLLGRPTTPLAEAVAAALRD